MNEIDEVQQSLLFEVMDEVERLFMDDSLPTKTEELLIGMAASLTGLMSLASDPEFPRGSAEGIAEVFVLLLGHAHSPTEVATEAVTALVDRMNEVNALAEKIASEV